MAPRLGRGVRDGNRAVRHDRPRLAVGGQSRNEASSIGTYLRRGDFHTSRGWAGGANRDGRFALVGNWWTNIYREPAWNMGEELASALWGNLRARFPAIRRREPGGKRTYFTEHVLREVEFLHPRRLCDRGDR